MTISISMRVPLIRIACGVWGDKFKEASKFHDALLYLRIQITAQGVFQAVTSSQWKVKISNLSSRKIRQFNCLL